MEAASLPILSPTGLLHPDVSSPTSTAAMVAFPWWIHGAPVFLWWIHGALAFPWWIYGAQRRSSNVVVSST